MTRWLLCVVALLVMAAMPAAAAQRVLLAAPDTGRSLALTASAQGGLEVLRRAAAKAGTVRVIVGLRVPFAAEMALAPDERSRQRSEIASAQVALRARFSATVARAPGGVRSYASVPFMALQVTPAELDRLAADTAVISIAPDRMLRPSLAESGRLVRAPEAWSQGFSGLGQTVAILDSGVDKTHPFLAGKVVSEACYSVTGDCDGDVTFSVAPGSAAPCNVAGCEHGTHVAGIAAGKGSDFSGVARDASIIAIRVLNPFYGQPVSWDSDIIAGLERVYALRNVHRIAAANLSIGGIELTPPCDTANQATTAIITQLRSAGIATVVASGNGSLTDRMSVPACISAAVSVGAVSDTDWGQYEDGTPAAADVVTSFSNSSASLSLLAPGSVINSSVPGGGFANMQGTSMAAPHVAGAFAVLRQKYPTASVDGLLARLQATGIPVSDYRAPDLVKPRIDVASALAPGIVTLSFVKAGNGSGSVRLATPGLVTPCPASCTISLEIGTTVSATALPGAGSMLGAWAGACSGAASCSFTLMADTTLTARFVPRPTFALTYRKAGRGKGSVAFAPAGGSTSCAAGCVQRYAAGTVVRLRAAPAKKMKFMGWSGACRGTGACIVTLTRAKAVNATFVPR